MFRCEATILRTLVGDQNFPSDNWKKSFSRHLAPRIKKLISDPANNTIYKKLLKTI